MFISFTVPAFIHEDALVRLGKTALRTVMLDCHRGLNSLNYQAAFGVGEDVE